MAKTYTPRVTADEIAGLPSITLKQLETNLTATVFNVKAGTQVQILDKNSKVLAVMVTAGFYTEHAKAD